MQQGLTAMTERTVAIVNGTERGLIERMPNDYEQTLDVREGGSNMRMVFADGSSIPVEQISTFGVQQ